MTRIDKRPREVSRQKYTLDELLARITPENTHPETDWGSPVGRECPNSGWDQPPKRACRSRRTCTREERLGDKTSAQESIQDGRMARAASALEGLLADGRKAITPDRPAERTPQPSR